MVKALDILELELGSGDFRRLFRSITFDNGPEFQDIDGIEESSVSRKRRTTIFFAHPYCASERGSNERHNGIIRRFIPKGSAIGNYSNMFSSLNGKYNAANDMSNVIAQRSQIQSGSYGKLMKAYVGKVGNKAALNAYRETGSTATSVTEVSGASETSASKSTSAKSVQADKAAKYASYKSGYLDSHLSSIGKAKTSSASASGKSFLDKHLAATGGEQKTGIQRAIDYAEATTGVKNPITYNPDGSVQTSANMSAAVDTQL